VLAIGEQDQAHGYLVDRRRVNLYHVAS
jgi:hypothetical protein